MSQDERIALLTLALVAVFANGPKDERELVQLRRVLEQLSPAADTNLSLLLQDVQLKRRSTQETFALLQRPETNQLAYEIAVCVCDVDGVHSDSEHRFLEELRIALALDVRSARSFERIAGAISDLTLSPDPVRGFGPGGDAANSQGLDQDVLGVAAFCAALAQSGACLNILAIIPLQMKMLYRIARAYDAQRERGQVKELMTGLGAAALSQYIQSFGLFLFSDTTASATAAFANSYALGHAAKLHYADEHVGTPALAEQFERLQAQGRLLSESHAADIEDKVRILNSNELLDLLRQQ